jgi:hypothetical protein
VNRTAAALQSWAERSGRADGLRSIFSSEERAEILAALPKPGRFFGKTPLHKALMDPK